MAEEVNNEEKAVKKPMYEVIPGQEARTIMARGSYNLKEKHSQKTLKYLYELGLTKYIRKNG